MNIIEQAAKRIEELRRAGIDVSVPGGEAPAAQPEAGASQGAAPAAPTPRAMPVQAAAPAGVPMPDIPAAPAPAATQPTARAVPPGAQPRFTDTNNPHRRSREILLDLDALRRNGFLVPGTDRSRMEEEYRIIKRPLLKNAVGESAAPIARANLIMVTSALPGEGKTFTSINLAMSIAKELDHTVLLVDADVVRPSVLGRLGLPPARGLMDLLTDRDHDLADVLLKTNIPKLTLLPAGHSSTSTTELLASAAMEELLDELATHYSDRIIIFDAPPLRPSTESRVLASRMGQVMVVVEADKTSRSNVQQAFSTLEACPVVMGMINKYKGSSMGSGYGYYAPTT